MASLVKGKPAVRVEQQISTVSTYHR